MDFLNLAKQGYNAYEQSNSRASPPDYDDDSFTKTGGQELNRPHHGSNNPNPPQFDEDEVAAKASSHGSGDSSLFSSALQFVQSSPDKHQEPIDEDEATEAHRQAYSDRSAGGMSASSMGTAAALQIMKQFTGGGGGNKPSSKSDLISLAMAEASKLFDKSGGAAQGSKQDAVNSAGMTIMKLMVQSQLGGGGSSGGLGGLMSMAGKFM